MRFREATNADREKVVRLVEQCLHEFDLVLDYETSDEDLVDIDESYVRSGGVLVIAEGDDGSLLGTVALSPTEPGKAKLRKMYVSADARGQGLGRKLLTEALAQARRRGFAELTLETTHRMVVAQALYESVGFRQVPGCPQSPRCERIYRLELQGG